MTRATPFLLLLPIAGCGTLDDPVPATPMPESYAVYDPAEADRAEPTDTRWWLAFGDAELNRVIEVSLAQNISLSARYAQIMQAEAVAREARAARMPQVGLSAQVGWNRSPGALGDTTTKSASVSVPVSYEVDLFARYARTHQAAQLEADATVEDYRSMQIATSAQVAEAFYDLVFARARVKLLEHQLEVNETYLELVLLRFREGLVASLDVYQQREQTLSSEAALVLAKGTAVIAEQQLAALLGMPSLEPQLDPSERTQMPDLGPPPNPGVPAALLEQRPDVLAARRRIEAADRRVSAAISARLPVIRLNVAPGWAYNNTDFGSDVPFGGSSSGFTLSAGASLDMPLFDGLARRARVENQEAQLQVQIETLANTIVQGLIEVETAIVREEQARRNVAILETQVQVAAETLEASQERYRSGLSDFLPVLVAIRAQQASQLNLLQSKRDLISARIQLHRALGGTWPEEATAPPRESSVVEEES